MEMVAIDVQPLLEDSKDIVETPQRCNEKFSNFISSPKTVLGVSTIFLSGYVTFIAVEGGFSSDFIHFGPGSTTFLGIVLDTWEKVILLYFVSFLSSMMNTYYTYAMTNNLHSYIWNRAVDTVPFSKRWTYVVTLAEPFIIQILVVTQFFTNLTMQLQFILPQFLGSIIIEVPFSIERLREKKYKFP